MIFNLDKKIFSKFAVKFLGVYLVFNLSYLLLCSATDPTGKLHSSLIIDHFNVLNGLRNVIIAGAQLFLSFFDLASTRVSNEGLRLSHVRVNLNNACLGFNIMAFWIAFIYASENSGGKKLKWIAMGLAAVLLLNILRIAILLLALKGHWNMVLAVDSHTLFNVVVYGIIFLFIFLYGKFGNYHPQGNAELSN